MHRLEIRLNDKEYKKLIQNSEKAKITYSGYVRNLIVGIPVKEPPSRDYKKLYNEINAIGHNINQITRLCNQGEELLLFKKQLMFYMDELYKLLDRNI